MSHFRQTPKLVVDVKFRLYEITRCKLRADHEDIPNPELIRGSFLCMQSRCHLQFGKEIHLSVFPAEKTIIAGYRKGFYILLTYRIEMHMFAQTDSRASVASDGNHTELMNQTFFNNFPINDCSEIPMCTDAGKA